MGLSFGWRASEVRESIWIGDPSLVNVSAAARAAWREDGDASHLRPFATAGQPSIITIRTLTPDEVRLAAGYLGDEGAVGDRGPYARAMLSAFRMAIDFPDAPEAFNTPDGARHERVVKERGTRMLANEFVTQLELSYRGIVAFYGDKILKASFATDAEKKASSPPSMPTRSGEAGTTPGSTAPPSTSEAA